MSSVVWLGERLTLPSSLARYVLRIDQYLPGFQSRYEEVGGWLGTQLRNDPTTTSGLMIMIMIYGAMVRNDVLLTITNVIKSIRMVILTWLSLCQTCLFLDTVSFPTHSRNIITFFLWNKRKWFVLDCTVSGNVDSKRERECFHIFAYVPSRACVTVCLSRCHQLPEYAIFRCVVYKDIVSKYGVSLSLFVQDNL